MSNVNNLNGIPNFGHGEPEAVIPTTPEPLSVDEVGSPLETEDTVKKNDKSKKAK